MQNSENKVYNYLGLRDEGGTILSDQWDLCSLVVQFFQGLLSAPTQPSIEDASRYFYGHISMDMVDNLIALIIDAEIRKILFSIPDDKSLWSNRFASLFFKRSWDIIGVEFKATIRHFFAIVDYLDVLMPWG